MMTDIRNLQAFALYMQKTDIKFDLYSVTKEIEKQVQFLFWLRLQKMMFCFFFTLFLFKKGVTNFINIWKFQK